MRELHEFEGRTGSAPEIRVCETPLGLREAYRYPPGPPGRDWTHVHADVQICLSHDTHGSYRDGRWRMLVPAGAVSAIDAWEPHAAEDVDSTVEQRASIYDVLYIPQPRWDAAAAALDQPARFGAAVTSRPAALQAMRRLLRYLDDRADPLALDAALLHVIASIVETSETRRRAVRDVESGVTARRLDRARQLLHARFRTGVSLAELARVAGLEPSYIVDAFRRRFGVPPHRMQTQLRLDLAKRCLAAGATIAEAAADAGFVDQSHLTRQSRRYLGVTPGRLLPRSAPARDAADRDSRPDTTSST